MKFLIVENVFTTYLIKVLGKIVLFYMLSLKATLKRRTTMKLTQKVPDYFNILKKDGPISTL